VQYYKLAQEMHPDKNKGKTTDRFKEITAAYNVIGDAKKRVEYDNLRKYS
jgi:molecular chaperone DnaJ